jgi:hypothetical protein
MPEIDFNTEILQNEVNHVQDGHGYGTVSLHGSRIEANPGAKCEGIFWMRTTKLQQRSVARSWRIN